MECLEHSLSCWAAHVTLYNAIILHRSQLDGATCTSHASGRPIRRLCSHQWWYEIVVPPMEVILQPSLENLLRMGVGIDRTHARGTVQCNKGSKSVAADW